MRDLLLLLSVVFPAVGCVVILVTFCRKSVTENIKRKPKESIQYNLSHGYVFKGGGVA